ncbi:MAG: CsgG/HfaB family protein, partial [Myxococcota bacterium]|nr:CsgG/HfaB family protein [Myxococcota bacterium]
MTLDEQDRHYRSSMRCFCIRFWVLSALVFCGGVAVADDSTPIAVSYFANTSKKPELEPLKKGIAEMLITDLSVSKDIRLVERSRLNDVMKELDLQASKFVDKKTAAKIGK